MKHAAHSRELTKVLVQRDEYASLAMRDGEDLCVAWVPLPFPAPDDIAPCRFEFPSYATPNAGIQQELQLAVSSANGSTRSRPTNRRA